MKKLNTLVTIGLVLSLVLSTTAFASEQPSAESAVAENVSINSTGEGGEASPNSLDRTVGFSGGTISGGYGEVKVYLGKYLSYGALQACIAFSSTSGVVSCSVTDPDGYNIELGVMSITTSDRTLLTPIYGLKSGYYTFAFDASTTDSFKVSCSIYE